MRNGSQWALEISLNTGAQRQGAFAGATLPGCPWTCTSHRCVPQQKENTARPLLPLISFPSICWFGDLLIEGLPTSPLEYLGVQSLKLPIQTTNQGLPDSKSRSKHSIPFSNPDQGRPVFGTGCSVLADVKFQYTSTGTTFSSQGWLPAWDLCFCRLRGCATQMRYTGKLHSLTVTSP